MVNRMLNGESLVAEAGNIEIIGIFRIFAPPGAAAEITDDSNCLKIFDAFE